MNWYVLYTKPRTEKKAATSLSELGIECYCPTVAAVRQWSDRKKKIEVPLFPSHVFVRLEEQDRNKVFGVSQAVRYLFWLGKPAIVRNHEIEILQEWLNGERATVDIIPYKAGDRLTIVDGPFKNQTGIVQETSKKEVSVVLESLEYVVRIKWKACLAEAQLA